MLQGNFPNRGKSRNSASNRIALQTHESLIEFEQAAKLFSMTMRRLNAQYPMCNYSYRELHDHVKEELSNVEQFKKED